MDINVAYASDEKYTKYVYISVISILMNISNHNKLICYLMTPLPNKYLYLFENLKIKYPNFELKIHPIDEKKYADMDIGDTSLYHLNYTTYYRFAINEIEGIKKIIYLDTDIIINSDITELFCEELGNKTVGVCSDMPLDYISKYIPELKLKRHMYFNAGVLLIDLDKRKKNLISKTCLSLLQKGTYKFNDQDVLNIALQNECKWLEGKYNVQLNYFLESEKDFRNIGFDYEYYKKATKNPFIIHFTSGFKPRKIGCYHPYANIWYKTLFLGIKYGKGLLIWLQELFACIVYNIEKLIIPSYKNSSKIRRKMASVYRSLK